MLKIRAWFGILVLALGVVAIVTPGRASAAATLVQSVFQTTNNGSSITLFYPAAVTAGNLLIVVCSSGGAVSMTTPVGFSVAMHQSGTPSQAIYYKISDGTELRVDCVFSGAGFAGAHAYEYGGVDPAGVLLATGSAAGTGTAVGSGSLTTTTADALIFTGISILANTSISAWSNSFTERNDFASSGGNPNNRKTYAAADRSVATTGTYSTTATAGASGNWRGQIVAFRLSTPVLGVDIVGSTGLPVASPSVSLAAATSGFLCQSVTGTLGESTQRIRVVNTTASPAWTVAIAATSGSTASWTDGTNTYDFNDPSGAPAGCADGADTDTKAGQLAVSPNTGSLAPQAGCTTTGLSTGTASAFSEGSVNSITLLSASASAPVNCYWDLTGIGLTQAIPAYQTAGTYSLGLTLTVTAN